MVTDRMPFVLIGSLSFWSGAPPTCTDLGSGFIGNVDEEQNPTAAVTVQWSCNDPDGPTIIYTIAGKYN